MKMKKWLNNRKNILLPMLTIILVLLSMVILSTSAVAAPLVSPARQSSTPTPPPAEEMAEQKACVECHPDKNNVWAESPHARAFIDPVFQEGWHQMERSPECLICHPAEIDDQTNEYRSRGVTCEACHGPAVSNHPPQEIPTRSYNEYCGTCHPTTVGEVQISGHSAINDVSCVDCHDPHSQQILFEDPDDMCKDCHQEDLDKMDKTLSGVHLQEEIPCADCHTLDVPHTFLYNFKHEDVTSFYKGFDCISDINKSAGNRVDVKPDALGYLEDRMSWPLVHRVSRPAYAQQCSDCHVLDDKLRADFEAMGYPSSKVDEIIWAADDFPSIKADDLLVARPEYSLGWVYWLLGATTVFGVFEFSVANQLDPDPNKPKNRKGFLQKIRARISFRNRKK